MSKISKMNVKTTYTTPLISILKIEKKPLVFKRMPRPYGLYIEDEEHDHEETLEGTVDGHQIFMMTEDEERQIRETNTYKLMYNPHRPGKRLEKGKTQIRYSENSPRIKKAGASLVLPLTP